MDSPERRSRRIVVTGGAGYIGSFVSHALRDAGYEVIVIDNMSLGHRRSLPADMEVHEIDLGNLHAVRSLLADRRPAGVLHFAALTQVGESVEQPSRYWDTNVLGTKNLLDIMQDVGIEKLIFSSTAATYGVPVAIMNELHPQSPINPYGHSKLAMEFLIRDYTACPSLSLKACALRYFNACGAASDGSRGEDHTPETHLLPHVVAAGLGIRDAKRGYKGMLTIFGNDYDTRDGTCERDYVHVEDLARAHVAAYEFLDHKESHFFDAFNVGTSSGHTVQEVMDAAEQVLGEELGTEPSRLPRTIGPRRTGDPARLVADASKLQSTLGWHPIHSLSDSIRSVTRWMRSNPNGYGDA